jgi:hypothetical protein
MPARSYPRFSANAGVAVFPSPPSPIVNSDYLCVAGVAWELVALHVTRAVAVKPVVVAEQARHHYLKGLAKPAEAPSMMATDVSRALMSRTSPAIAAIGYMMAPAALLVSSSDMSAVAM